MVSVGEIVNGGPLPPVPRHTPVCSFNSQNKYVRESLATELPVGTQRPGVDAAGEGLLLREQPGHLSCVVGGVTLTSRCLVPMVKLREGGQSLRSVWVAQRLSSVCTFACSLVGAGRGEECGAEADAPPPALPQPLPVPAPAPAPTPTASVTPSLFLASVQPSMTPELPAKPVPVYSDAVRGLPGQAPRSPCAAGSAVSEVRSNCVHGPNSLRCLHVWP